MYQSLRETILKDTRHPDIATVAAKMLPPHMQAHSAQDWERFHLFLKALTPLQLSRINCDIWHHSHNLFRGSATIEFACFLDCARTFRCRLQRALEMVDKKLQDYPSMPKTWKQLPILRERLVKARGQCLVITNLSRQYTADTNDWRGIGLFHDWVLENTKDLYWVASFFRNSDVLPTTPAFQEAQKSVHDDAQWTPICYDEADQPTLICHPSMMDPADFLIKEEKTDSMWSTIAKFDYVTQDFHNKSPPTVRFGKKKSVAPPIIFTPSDI